MTLSLYREFRELQKEGLTDGAPYLGVPSESELLFDGIYGEILAPLKEDSWLHRVGKTLLGLLN
ncbi:MAG: hypothetical protein KKF68_00015 [Nanoarchaeota archaeon]|nr:hypothetical protein [Nanoarchaeota archaeon]